MTDANDITAEPSAMDRLNTAGAMLLSCGGQAITSLEQIDSGLLCGMWICECLVRRHGERRRMSFVSSDRDGCVSQCAAWIMATRDELVGAGEVGR